MYLKRKLLIATICILIVSIVVFWLYNKKEKDREDNQNFFEETEKLSEEDTNIVEEIKNTINATANTDMYQIDEEYDGRKIIQIKSDIQYDTVLAGILKNGCPQENEIEEILKSRPNKSGIWVTKNSQENFLNLLKRDHGGSHRECGAHSVGHQVQRRVEHRRAFHHSGYAHRRPLQS